MFQSSMFIGVICQNSQITIVFLSQKIGFIHDRLPNSLDPQEEFSFLKNGHFNIY